MNLRRYIVFCLLCLSALQSYAQVGPEHTAKMKEGLELFKNKVKGIFNDHCIRCHGGEKIKGKLDMSTRAKLLKGGFEDKGFVSGNHEESFLWKVINHEAEPFMPNKKPKLKQADIDAVATWIDLGAPYDGPLTDQKDDTKEFVITEEDKNFWSFIPLKKVSPPKVEASSDIDKFILAKQQKKGLKPGSQADKISLIRRLYFDLVGMPPTIEELNKFLSGRESYKQIADRLLGDKRYGERWARHWLDVARFGESTGYEHDYDRNNAYHYRDFVIKAFNSDMPFNQFMRWQLAGDEAAPDNPDAVAATGFLAAGVFPTQLTEREFEGARYDEMDDMASTASVAFLGLAIGCARCHDHKFDPLSANDYYNFIDSFTLAKRAEILMDITPKNEKKAHEKQHKKQLADLNQKLEEANTKAKQGLQNRIKDEKGIKALEKQRGAPKNIFAKLLKKSELNQKEKDQLFKWYISRVDRKPGQIAGQIKKLKTAGPGRKINILASTEGLPKMKHHANGRGYPHFYPQTYFLERGDPARKKGVVSQKFFEVLMRNGKKEDHWIQKAPKGSRNSFRRTSLANWIEDVDNGAGNLFARVIVNRIWQYHFGSGIVNSANDFGFQGQRPTHPELLDWLAGELIKSGWRLKHIHRLILNSSTYKVSSAGNEANEKIDPDNEFMWKWKKRRIKAESIRDSILQISGLLDKKMFGPGEKRDDMYRRSIYYFLKRSRIPQALQLFDFPEPLVSQGTRPVTTIAPQALYFMNNPFIRNNAVHLAQSLLKGSAVKTDNAVKTVFLKTLSRQPTAGELANSSRFIRNQEKAYKANGVRNGSIEALADFCQAMFSLNESIYTD